MALAFIIRLYELIGTLEEIGVLNGNFTNAYELKPARGSRYFLDLVLRFCDDMETGLRELALTLEQPVVDYEKLLEHHMNIRGSATRIGACALGLAIEELRKAIDTASKDRCNLAVLHMRQEYHFLRLHLGTIIELERRIIHL